MIRAHAPRRWRATRRATRASCQSASGWCSRAAATTSRSSRWARSRPTGRSWPASTPAASTTNSPGSRWPSSRATPLSPSSNPDQILSARDFLMTADTPGAAAPATARLIARIADSKYFLGRHMAEWCAGAPTLESAVAAAAMAQDELGHARALYPLLRTLDPASGPENEPETRTRFVNMAVLDQPFADWADFIPANFLGDGALTLLFESAVAATYEPRAGRARKAWQEERTHAMHAEPGGR